MTNTLIVLKLKAVRICVMTINNNNHISWLLMNIYFQSDK